MYSTAKNTICKQIFPSFMLMIINYSAHHHPHRGSDRSHCSTFNRSSGIAAISRSTTRMCRKPARSDLTCVCADFRCWPIILHCPRSPFDAQLQLWHLDKCGQCLSFQLYVFLAKHRHIFAPILLSLVSWSNVVKHCHFN